MPVQAPKGFISGRAWGAARNEDWVSAQVVVTVTGVPGSGRPAAMDPLAGAADDLR
jgi:hypothetical protein